MASDGPESRSGEAPGEGQGGAAGLFREEALRYHLAEEEEGDVLRLSPAWTRWTFWLLLAVVGAGLLYLWLGRVPVYQSGPALLRVDGRTSLFSAAAGTVLGVDVRPGERVEAGQVLVRFRDDRELAELAKIEREFELHLADRLREPGDASAGEQLKRLGAERDLLLARLEATLVRAPVSGIVGDVRIRPGQFLDAGQPVLSLFPADPSYSVVGLLPGNARPQLARGMRVRLEIVGYPYAYEWATLEEVGDQVVGPSEARRFLGPEAADSIPVGGPVVLVVARLDTDTFQSGEREYQLHDGMLAQADVEVRTERLLVRLVPGLKALGGGGDA